MTTLSSLVEDCRQRYNAVGDKFFSDDELFDLVYDAEMEIALECEAIEEIYTTTTVASQREYDYPSRAIRIHRVTYDGRRLSKIDFVEDDMITGSNEDSTSTGDPSYYATFSSRIFLRPLPSEAKTLKIYAIVEPSEHTSITSSITVPQRYRTSIKDYVLSQMYAKDKNSGLVTYHENRWQRAIDRIKRFEMKKNVSDAYKVVKDVDYVQTNDIEPWS